MTPTDLGTLRRTDRCGREVVTDFRNNGDTLELNDTLSGTPLATAKVDRKCAEVENGYTVFAAGRDEIVLDGFRSLAALADDIEIA